MYVPKHFAQGQILSTIFPSTAHSDARHRGVSKGLQKKTLPTCFARFFPERRLADWSHVRNIFLKQMCTTEIHELL
jgi:hypothetical protein